MKKINITSGECLREQLEKEIPEETFIPFNEAMIKGNYSAPLFSEEFCKERALVHGTTVADYVKKLGPFMALLKQAKDVDEITLWFGDEPFCQANRAVCIQALEEAGYSGKLNLNIVSEPEGKLLSSQVLKTSSK